MTQRMFHGSITSAALVDQLAAQFNERHYRTSVSKSNGSALIQIGSPHGTPLSLSIADTQGGLLVTMGQDRDWLDRAGDVGDMIEHAAHGDLLSIVSIVPDLVGELKKENLAPAVWSAIDEIFSLSRLLAGEEHGPRNPKICLYCETSNPPENALCQACGASLPEDLPRICPKCGRGHTSDALFCQSCGTRLVNE